jgi:hypothetical protein
VSIPWDLAGSHYIFDTNLRLLRHVLIDFREDGVTPYATVWKHGFKEVKV